MIRQTCILSAAATIFPMMASLAVAEPAIQQNELVPASAALGDLFGASVSVDGTTGIVGAFGVDEAGSIAGAAYLVDLATGEELMRFLPEPGSDFFRFGNSVSISGGMALVGAPGDDSISVNNGSAYLFDVNTGELIRKLVNPNPPIGGVILGEAFGAAVALRGNLALIGAPDTNVHSISSASQENEEQRVGSAYLFDVESGELLYSYDSLDVANDSFAISVALSDSHAIIGSLGSNIAGPGFTVGYALVIDLKSGEVTHTLNPPNDSRNFGISVAISGSIGIIGQTPSDFFDTRRAYIYDLETGENLFVLVPDPPAIAREFGRSVALCDSYAIVGDPGDRAYGFNSGAVYIFSTSTGEQLAALRPDNPQASSRFGYAVSASEDFAVLSAPTHLVEPSNNGGETASTGLVYIYTPTCPGDCNSDAAVAFSDLITMLARFGTPATQGCDTDGNELIDFNDLVLALFRFGDCEQEK